MIEYAKDIILNSNLSLRRNIEGYAFPTTMDEDKSLEILRAFEEIYKDELILLDELDENTLNRLINDGILSEDCDVRTAKVGLVIKDDYILTINDRDHIAINVKDFNIDIISAYKKAEMVEDFLDKKFDFAFSPQYGYLTSDARNAGLGLEISYRLFLFGLLDSSQTYMALKSTLAHEGAYFTRFVPKYYSNYSKDVYVLKNFGNYRANIEDYIDSLESAVDSLVKNERRFRRDYQILNKITDDDVFDQIEMVENNLNNKSLRSLEVIVSALFELKKYNNLGFRTTLSNNELDYLIFNTTKNKYKGDRDKERYEFLNSYMEDR